MLGDHVIDAVAVGNCADVPLLISHTARRDAPVRGERTRVAGHADRPTTTSPIASDHVFADGVRRGSRRTAVAEPGVFADGTLALVPHRRPLPHARLRLGRGTAHSKPDGVDGPVLVAVWCRRWPTRRLPRDRDPVPVHRRRQPRWDDGGRWATRTARARDPGRLGRRSPERATPTRSVLPEWPRYSVEHRLVMELDDECKLIEDPDGDIRRLWPLTANV